MINLLQDASPVEVFTSREDLQSEAEYTPWVQYVQSTYLKYFSNALQMSLALGLMWGGSMNG